jgi:amino acid adenylation domain-containing protein
MQNDARLERLKDLSPAKRALLLKKLTQQARGSTGITTITPRLQQDPAVLSFAQQQLFYLYLLDPQNAVYNLPISLRLIGQLDLAVLLESLKTIVQRHDILRTTITLIDGQPAQIVDPAFVLTPQLIDARAWSSVTLDEAIVTELSTPFDLVQGPLLRVTLFSLSDTEHVLLLNMPHIISDGWSNGVLMRELNILYSAQLQGLSNPLPALPIQYADYAVWQRERLQGAVLDGHLAYWRRYLADVPPMLDLPTDYQRPVVQQYRGSNLSFCVPEDVRVALHQLSQAEGATLFMTLLAAFQVVLSRSSGQTDFLVGTPTANRTHEETEGLIGCFINTLVIRSKLTDNPSFRTLLRRVREACLDAYEHQELPFERLVEALQPERNTSYNPLFQVMFALQNAPDTSPDLPGLRVEALEEQGQSAKFDLTLSMTEGAKSFEAVLEYNSDLFERATMERFQGHFLTLLQGIVAAPDQQIADLPLITREEQDYLLHEIIPPFTLPASTQCLHQLVEEQVRRTPDALALVCGEASLTYRQLDRRANALAAQLRARGVGPEVLVGICVQRSLDLVVGLLGILKAGGAYAPLDPTYPEERLSYILADTQAPVLITQRAVSERVAAYAGNILWLDEMAGQEEEQGPAPAVCPANLAYVIYTSGSTGRPKGVAITHSSAALLVAWALKTYTSEELRGVLISTSVCFDLSIFEIFVPLSMGGTGILLEHALQLGQQSGEVAVTLVNTVPSAARELVRRGDIPATVQTINLAGEALPLQLAQDLYAQTSVSRVFNLYGPSEDTTYSTGALLPPTITDEPAIGYPIERTRVYLLDQRLNLVPAGMAGEIYIGGDGLARGYLHRPDLTAERFVPDPFSGEAGARLYKTGDLARYRSDGSLAFLGRIDHQVKVRGFRVELGEIETVLGSHPGLRECLVMVQKDEADVAHLMAYGIPQSTSQVSSDDLRGYLQQRLPHYMVPSVFLLLDAFPLTPNGKVDRRALAAFSQRAPVSLRNLQGPRDSIELRLVQLWEKVLQTAPISVSDNFFDLGGHSLLAIQLVEQMQRQFACSIPLSVLVQQGTVEHLAHLIRAGGVTMQQSPLVLLQPAGDAAPFFCVHPAGGSVLCYVDLARHLDRPFYGLQADEQYENQVSVRELAAQYVAAIQSVQPQGPYLLGGWSLGGVIALEMAQQLTAQGQDVTELLLIDSIIPALSASVSESSQLDMLAGFTLHLGLSQERITAVQALLARLSWEEQWACLVREMKDAGILPADIDTTHLHQRFRVYQATVHAWLAYRPQTYQGSLTLLRASDRSGRDDSDPTMGWQKIGTGRLTVTDIPGDHYTLMRQPYVLSLAEQVQRSLAQASDKYAIQRPQEVLIDGIQ